MKAAFKKSQGFTLVELAVSLVVIGLLIGLGTAMVGPLMTSIKVRESKETIGGVMESTNSWAASNNTLPDTSAFSTAAAKTPNDAWGRPFIYLYDANLQAGNPTKDTICGRRSTPLTLNILDPVAIIPNVAYLVFSLNDDATSNTSLTGTLTTLTGTTALTGGLVTASGSITPTAPATTATISVDTANDIVRWVTLDELRTKVGCQGAQLKVANNELPYAYNQTTYTATIYADGGVPYNFGGRYRWCVQNSAGAVPANMTFKNTAGTSNIPFNTDCASLAESLWVQSDSILISGLPTVNVTGTDGKIYTAIQSHTAAAANQPITGASYATYWQLASGGAVGSTWTAGMYYTTMSQSLSIFVRDNNDSLGTNDSIAYKQLVLTINAQ